MKKIILILSVLLSLKAGAQCDDEPYKVLTVHYTYAPKGSGIGMEYGYVGKFNIHAGVSVFAPKPVLDEEKQETVPQMLDVRMPIKLGYRVFREPYVISLYTYGFVGISLNDGGYAGASTRVLVPFASYNAVSLEPAYIFTTKQFNIQASLHFIIY